VLLVLIRKMRRRCKLKRKGKEEMASKMAMKVFRNEDAMASAKVWLMPGRK